MQDWNEDLLGPGFERLDLDLEPDDEGPLTATLVRSLPAPRRLWDRITRVARLLDDVDVLYVHGWSDYFFQRELARFWTNRGARFFALDLRKYGRSLHPGQTPGYIEDLTDYDEEIGRAVDEIGSVGRGRRLVLLGHSTGGLVLSLWADRHRGVADALVLNSPWLELQLSASGRRTLAPVVNLQARFSPRELAVPQLDLGFYKRAQSLVAAPEEQGIVNLEWRPEQAQPVRAGWLRAILSGHARIEAGVDVGAPACVLLSARSHFAMNWSDEMLRTDTVLDVENVARAALKLGPSVTIERVDGALHDVFLSERRARAEAFARLERWIAGWSLARPSAEDRASPTGRMP